MILPAAGQDAKFITREDVSKNIIKALKDSKIPEVYGFVNGSLLYQNRITKPYFKGMEK